MTQEEEAKDIIENYCQAHDDDAVNNTVAKLMDWFKNWKAKNGNNN